MSNDVELKFWFWSRWGRWGDLDELFILPLSKAQETLKNEVLNDSKILKECMELDSYDEIHSAYKFIQYLINTFIVNNPEEARIAFESYYDRFYNYLIEDYPTLSSKDDFITKISNDVNYLYGDICNDYEIDEEDISNFLNDCFCMNDDCISYYKDTPEEASVRKEILGFGIYVKQYKVVYTQVMEDIINGTYKARLENEKSS